MFRAELSPPYLKHRFRIKLNYPECLENERGYILILTKTKVNGHSSSIYNNSQVWISCDSVPLISPQPLNQS